MMIRFKDITEDNFREIIDMKLPEGQNFVASNIMSLAQAWLYKEIARPFAIYHEDELIGFIMLDWAEATRELGIWRLMIATEHQGKGYGQEVIRKVIGMARRDNKFDRIELDYAEKNSVAEHVYSKLGFKPTGQILNGAVVMEYRL